MTRRVDTNMGALALRKCGKTQSEVARLCGVSRTIVSEWWHGRKVPGPEHRARLEALGLVKAEQWEGKPTGAPVVRPSAVSDEVRGKLDTRTKLESQVRRLEALLQADLSATAAVQVERALGSALAALAKLDGTQISEQTLLRHPAHQRVMAVVFAALEGHPEAARAVADALKAVSG